jgi:integrase/recombinase XerC
MSLTKVLKINLKKSGITKKIRLHDLRHSRATHLLESSLEIEHIRALLGHKKISTTQQYLHLSVKSLKDAIFRIEN